MRFRVVFQRGYYIILRVRAQVRRLTGTTGVSPVAPHQNHPDTRVRLRCGTITPLGHKLENVLFWHLCRNAKDISYHVGKRSKRSRDSAALQPKCAGCQGKCLFRRARGHILADWRRTRVITQKNCDSFRTLPKKLHWQVFLGGGVSATTAIRRNDILAP